ncbi:MFS transporter [Polymorphobacter sp. PAMC 29334]|uniref:MFS transporter n=1 Tax=Polymorphobacter sp. PAMC 29334 TaxID=2862331 RepID=UPI001C684042|nr:MFS transporter [Polymorphobacter sp. PAMC 29334]QYE36400.1 MFS transporter [Polymorphobacter sp. PAMC 29334]
MTAASIAAAARPSRARLFILALMTLATMLNYLDRAVIGVAAPSMSKELGLSAVVLGLVFSSFSWTYAAAQIPGGLVLDRLGTRLTYALSLGVWSLVTLLHAFAANLGMLLAFRFGLGVAEAPCYPCNSRILATWFPQSERARATSVYSVGQYFGLAFMTPLLFWIVAHWGWRALFLVVGGVGIAFGWGWYLLYRDPAQSRAINDGERALIAAGGGVDARPAATAFSWANVGRLLSKRQILGASIGQFASNSTLVFFITWFPTYLATERHMDWIKSGVFAVLPYIAASVGVLIGGAVSDWLIRRTGSANIGRKLPVVAGLLLTSTILLANYVDDNRLVILVMSIAFFGQGICNLGWTLISDVAPKEMIGLTGGVFNLCANLAGIVTPIVIGFVVAATGSFYGALAYIGAVALLGAGSYIFIVGDVHRVEL